MKKIGVILLAFIILSMLLTSCGVEINDNKENIPASSENALIEITPGEEPGDELAAVEHVVVDSFVYPTENMTERQTLPAFSEVDNPFEYAMYVGINTIEEFDKFIAGVNKSYDENLIVTGKKITSRSYYSVVSKTEYSFEAGTAYSDNVFCYTLTRFQVEAVCGGNTSVKPGDIITVAERYSYRPDGSVYAFGYFGYPPMYNNETYLLFLGKKENKAVFAYGEVEDAWKPASVILIDDLSTGKIEVTEENYLQKGYFQYFKAGAAIIQKYVG